MQAIPHRHPVGEAPRGGMEPGSKAIIRGRSLRAPPGYRVADGVSARVGTVSSGAACQGFPCVRDGALAIRDRRGGGQGRPPRAGCSCPLTTAWTRLVSRSTRVSFSIVRSCNPASVRAGKAAASIPVSGALEAPRPLYRFDTIHLLVSPCPAAGESVSCHGWREHRHNRRRRPGGADLVRRVPSRSSGIGLDGEARIRPPSSIRIHRRQTAMGDT